MGAYEYDDSEEYADLASRLDVLEDAAAQDFDLGDSGEDDLATMYAAEAQLDGRTARQHLKEIALQTRQAVFDQASNMPQPPATDQEIFLEAVQIASVKPEDGLALLDYVTANDMTSDFDAFLATRDPVTIAKGLMTVKSRMSTDALAEINRANKNAAQTMSGSSSSRETETLWDRIKAANSDIRFGR